MRCSAVQIPSASTFPSSHEVGVGRADAIRIPLTVAHVASSVCVAGFRPVRKRIVALLGDTDFVAP